MKKILFVIILFIATDKGFAQLSQTRYPETADGGFEWVYGGYGGADAIKVLDGQGVFAIGNYSGDIICCLKGTNFGFTIPVGSTITGIVLYKTGSSWGVGYPLDNTLMLINAAGSLVGDNKANTSEIWAETYQTWNYGTSSDKWGYDWTVDEINSPGFGISLEALIYTYGGWTRGYIDAFSIRVYYSPPKSKNIFFGNAF
ncbi:MAG: hypothetical protein WCO63_01365 [Bacteroidota bacterium]